MKYLSKQITLQEVPNEISLSYLITGCPGRCRGCHSLEARDGSLGEELTVEVLKEHLRENEGITCVCFLGGDWEKDLLIAFLIYIKGKGLKTCLYSGKPLRSIPNNLLDRLDYVKGGPYIEELGGLDSPNTNQVFLNLETGENLNKYFLK